MTEQKDRALRAITDDGAFRVITIRATDTVQAIIDAQKVSGDAAALIGQLATGAVLVREMMAPNMRVQAILASNPPRFSFMADAQPGGATRGIVSLPKDGGPVELGDSTYLQLIRVLYNNELQQGIVHTHPDKGLSASLTTYMHHSEQISTLIGVECVMSDEDPSKVQTAGGYIVQLLPEADEAAIALMTIRGESLGDMAAQLVETDADPVALMSDLLEHFKHHHLEETAVFFGCNCSMERVVGALATMGREEIQDVINKGLVLEIDCDYCSKQYAIGAELLRPLLQKQ